MVKRFACMLLLLYALPAQAAQDVLIEAELEPAEVRVQAQAVYRLRVLHAVDVRELRMVGPSARLADFRVIGDDRVFEAQRDGRRYRVHERSYAVIPFASGTLELSGAYATGRTATTAVRLEAPARAVTLLPIEIEAAGIDATPLPARAPDDAQAADTRPALGVMLAGLLALLLYRRRSALRLAWQLRRAGDARRMRDSLLQAAATVWRSVPPTTLGALAEHMDDAEAREALLHLERALYGPDVYDETALRAAARIAGRAIAMMAERRIIR
jgi:hypothetical protein